MMYTGVIILILSYPNHCKDNELLKYSIRSSEKFRDGEVIITGAIPNWYKGEGIEQLMPREYSSFDYVKSLKPGYFMADDLFFNSYDEIIPDLIKVNDYGASKSYSHKDYILNTLKQFGNVPEGFLFDTHVPFYLSADDLNFLQDVDIKKFHCRSLIMMRRNKYQHDLNNMNVDMLISDMTTDIFKKFKEEKAWHFNRHIIDKSLFDFLEKEFPHKSKYEK